MIIKKSAKLDRVCYDIRGPVLHEAMRMEKNGEKILKLNIGNPAPFGLFTSGAILQAVNENLKRAQGYCDSKGLRETRSAISDYYTARGFKRPDIENIYTGNGVSELITITMQALLDSNDEILIPSPDSPLWTAAVNLSGGKPVHYRCDEASGWQPDISDIKKKITSRTRGLVIINPNNPTGAVYDQSVIEKIMAIAEQYGIIIFSDEIYDNIIYEGKHCHAALFSDKIPVITFGGLSKSARIAGFRIGWIVLSGNLSDCTDYIEGLNMLSSMRLCSNVPAQYTVLDALTGPMDISGLIRPGGRLYEQREACCRALSGIPGISFVKPSGAFYFFPRFDAGLFSVTDDEKFILDFLRSARVLLVQGSAFNWPQPDHFRIVFLPETAVLTEALNRLGEFLKTYRQESA